jgi:hypothetical protein
MLKRSLVSPDDPVPNLQLALAIELAVLPPYFYACWSVKPRSEGASIAAAEASRTIRSISYQEMLHVAVVANILGALGQRPDITGQLMTYPGNLPGHVTSGPDAFTVGLAGLSESSVSIFMKIELPQWKQPKPKPEDPVAEDWMTLGEFYDSIKKQMHSLDDGAFRHGRQLPPRDNPGAGYLGPVNDRKSALRAIDSVIEQGEGHKPANQDQPTPEEQRDGAWEAAHYYQLQTILGYFTATPALIVRERDVYPVIDNPNPADFSSEQQRLNLEFNCLYSQLLDSLQAALDGAHPEVFGAATRLMIRLEHAAAMLRAAGPVPCKKFLAGPTFAYVPSHAGSRAPRSELQGV